MENPHKTDGAIMVKEIAKKIKKRVSDFIKDSNLDITRQSLNELKLKNPQRYNVQTLGMMCVNLGLNYDDLIKMKNNMNNKLSPLESENGKIL